MESQIWIHLNVALSFASLRIWILHKQKRKNEYENTWAKLKYHLL